MPLGEISVNQNPIIAALKARLESEKNKIADENWNTHSGKLVPAALGWIEKDLIKIGHEAATERLMTVIEQALGVIEFYGDRNNWRCWDTYADVKDVITVSDLGCKSYSEKADYALPSGGRRAREFLLSIRETVADASTLADASGDSKKEQNYCVDASLVTDFCKELGL